MLKRIEKMALVVREYDEAIAFYVDKLGFRLLEDKDMGGGKRWVVVAPPGDPATALLLARAVNDEQRAAIGRQTGGRVFLFLTTDDFAADHERLKAHGVKFVRGPAKEAWGTVGVFEDLYGNLWDLIGP